MKPKSQNPPEPLTREGYQKLEAELHSLRTSQRSAVAETLHNAVDEGGDLLENTAFLEAKTEQAWLEARIEYLEMILHNVEIIEDASRQFPCDQVHLNSVVTVQQAGYAPEIYHIVGTAEANPLEGQISDACPLGSALLGKRVGEIVIVHTPDGDTTFRILDVH